MAYRTAENYIQRDDENEPGGGASQTIPGEALSIREILTRAMGGIEPERKNYTFFDQEDLDKIDKFYGAGLDLTDLDELGDRLIELNDSVVKAVAKRDAEAVIIPVVEPPPAVVPEPEPTTE